MEVYTVRVNGIEYEVEIEKKGESTAAPAAQVAPVQAAASTPAPKAAPAGTGKPVTCGTAGKVWKIVAKEGDTLSSGDQIAILEAMKMEIPVVAPEDGVLDSIAVSEGEAVESGQAIAYMR
ncbi:biotin/lipoyl-containing protein [Eubacterium sp. AB3007]|uniref:biotin/lipoyl-containing protein n=1 Tax=Eubacterium sp. AB3007 TaxID=1392487 RepID=UPI00047F0C76|nr:biotin/lipoyl-containing protein [Eubacterium sp. AB3007]MBQ1471187.1 acetyl-CoA carboxylase biotin carboxyl carrier protein subunit [Eubacterium sp.]